MITFKLIVNLVATLEFMAISLVEFKKSTL